MDASSSSDAPLILAGSFFGHGKDRDGDGVRDKNDRCPDEAQGPNGVDGCPIRDRDLDGVLDEADRCTDVHQGPLGANGCPPSDIDHDGICDGWVSMADLGPQFAAECSGTDLCPDVPGSVAERGCPNRIVAKPVPVVLDVKQKTLVLKGVNFETGKSVLLPSSFPVLDGLVRQLLDVPEVQLQVSGHTDNKGSPKLNRILSQARAQAVMDYLIQHGVAASRLSAQGFGPDRPIQTNTTPEGRAENRRVEFNRLK